MQQRRHNAAGGNTVLEKKQTKQSPKNQPDYEKLGRLLYAIGQSGTSSRKSFYKVAFWRGVWSGLGHAVGATIVISILLWFFTVLGSVPLIGEFIELVKNSLPQVN